jgi:hypothetical protein
MKVLFDQGTPVPLRRFLHPHVIDTASERGWSRLRNGELLDQAEASHYDAFNTTDMHLRYQQNLTQRVIRTPVLPTTSWPRIRERTVDVMQALDNLAAGGYTEVDI